MVWFRLGAIGLGVLLVVAVTLLLYGSWSWRLATDALVAQLDRGATPCSSATYHAADVDTLPPPVARFFHASLHDGQPIATRIRVSHDGQFNVNDTSWSPFSSTQVFRVIPPGFVWDARVSMVPVVPARVHDRYLDGAGAVHATLGGLLTVARADGTPEVATAALQRYLAEAMWFPTALLPACGVRWTPIDDTHAIATITDRSTSASLEFHFNDRDDVADVFTPGRPRIIGKDAVPTPWRAINSEWGQRGGMRIPLESEVRWELGGRVLPYWRARITDVRYE
jgi:hypothetical protein